MRCGDHWLQQSGEASWPKTAATGPSIQPIQELLKHGVVSLNPHVVKLYFRTVGPAEVNSEHVYRQLVAGTRALSVTLIPAKGGTRIPIQRIGMGAENKKYVVEGSRKAELGSLEDRETFLNKLDEIEIILKDWKECPVKDILRDFSNLRQRAAPLRKGLL